MKNLLIIDGNAIGFAAASTKVLTVGEQETQAIYGFLRTLRQALGKFPTFTPLVLWDGVSWRKSFFTDYKASRDVAATAHDQKRVERRAGYKSQRPFITKALKLLGVRQMVALNLEADDLAGLMTKSCGEDRRVLLMTGDGDWLQLVRKNVTWFDPRTGDRVTVSNFREFTGVDTAHQWLEVKALMGDSSDEIPGVGGIGEKGAKELINTWGSVSGFLNCHLDGSIAKLPKKFSDFADDKIGGHSIWRRNMELMDLNHPKIPKAQDLRITKGELNPSAFHDFCEELLFNSITRDLDGWVEPFRERA